MPRHSVRPILLPLAALLALAPAAALAQTGYGKPTPQEYRDEQRTTATLNDAIDDGYDAAIDERRADPRYDAGRYDANRYARAPHLRGDDREYTMSERQWRAHIAACRRGDRRTCEATGDRAALRAPDGPYVFRGAGRYADGRDAYDARREAMRRDDPRPGSRYDNPYRDDDRYDDDRDGRYDDDRSDDGFNDR